MNRRITHVALALTLSLAVLHSAQAAPYVILKNGKKIGGKDIRAKSDGTIVLTTPTGDQFTFAAAQVDKAVADRPAEFETAVRMIQAKKYDDAIKILDKVARDYSFLEWDNEALAQTAKAYALKGDSSRAVSTYEKLFKASPERAGDSALQWEYRGSLLAAGNHAKLETELTETIEKGSRSDAARAQLMRGDIKKAKGDLKSAAMDYLRTVVLFEKERDVQPEALLKTANALEQLKDKRAGDMYKKLVNEYPASAEAAQARARL
ncbi:MAG: tetratricopeptide repeat protein [Verrucomicrobia bacterium]|nr:tetratricopeptide repeat protein [Verrucomicrobiota bacterium]